MLQISTCPINRANHILSSVAKTRAHLLVSPVQADLAKDDPSAYLAPGSNMAKMRGKRALQSHARPIPSSAVYPAKYKACSNLHIDYEVLGSAQRRCHGHFGGNESTPQQ